VLTSSVLNILGRQRSEPEVGRAERSDPARGFAVDESLESRQEAGTELTGLKAPFPGLKRPLLPDLPLNPLEDPASKQRGFEDFLRALDEVDRVDRRPEFDVFE